MITKGAIQLIEIDHKTVIDHQIQTIKKFDPSADICFVLGFEYEKIQKYILDKNYNVRTVINHNFKTTSQVDSLRIGVNSSLNAATYVIHGDMLFNKEALKTCHSVTESGVLSQTNNCRSKIGIQSVEGRLLNLAYGLPETWAQISFFTEKDFAKVRQIINSFKKNKLTYEFLNILNKDLNFRVFCSKNSSTREITKKYENSYN